MPKKRRLDLIADPVHKIACRKCGRHLDVSALESFSVVECPSCNTRQNVPAQLGQFLLLELLGMGGMGAVYKALDQSLGRYVAIKVMRKSLGDDKKFLQSFLSEARAAAALNHRHVVSIYSFGEERGQPYMVMELVDGGKLDEVISDGGMLDEVRALEIGVDIAEGLKAANDISLVHGDIKPANILFDQEGNAKVADFGLARFANWEQGAAGEVWGTPYYIAPEKARGQKVDHRSDIYSMGATLYHVMGAKPPFDGQTATDVVLARLKNPAIGLRVVRPDVQPETSDLIARMLEADPFMRYPTYSSLLADMREALRIAKREQVALGSKVKKSMVGPIVAIIFLIVVAGGILFTSLMWGKEEKKADDGRGTTVRHIRNLDELRNPGRGTVVSTATGEEGATNVAEDSMVAIAEDEPQGPVNRVVQPFNSAEQKLIGDAVQLLIDGKSRAMEERLQKLYDAKDPSDIGRLWLRLFQAVSCMTDGRKYDARAYLARVISADFETEGDRAHPGNMPQMVARYMMGQVDDGKLYFEASKWPEWYSHYTQFFLALDLIKQSKFDLARDKLDEYLGQKAEKPDWPYSLQPVAKQLLNQMDAWESLRSEVVKLVSDKQAVEARNKLEEFKPEVSGAFDLVLERAIQQVRKAEEVEAEERRISALKAHHELVQDDLDNIDQVRTSNLKYVAAKDYLKAKASLSKTMSKIKTPEGNETLLILRSSYEHMEDLKSFLIKSVKSAPFQYGNERVIDANATGIHVALGAHGALQRPWEKVKPKQFLKMSNHYIKKSDLSDEEKAERYMSLACFCYANGAFPPAETYAERAAEVDPKIKSRIRRLMPDIIGD